MPDLAWLHHQLAAVDACAVLRCGHRGFRTLRLEDVSGPNPYDNPDATTALFVMNDNYASSISFDDGIQQTTAGTYYDCFPVDTSEHQGLVVGFPPALS